MRAAARQSETTSAFMSLECAWDSLSYPPYKQIARPVEGLTWHLFRRTPVEQALITGRKCINGTDDTSLLFNDDTETSATKHQRLRRNLQLRATRYSRSITENSGGPGQEDYVSPHRTTSARVMLLYPWQGSGGVNKHNQRRGVDSDVGLGHTPQIFLAALPPVFWQEKVSCSGRTEKEETRP
jgi:hypothetical protein